MCCSEYLGSNKSERKINTAISSFIHEHFTNSSNCCFLDGFKINSKTKNSLDLLIFNSFLIQEDRPSLNS